MIVLQLINANSKNGIKVPDNPFVKSEGDVTRSLGKLLFPKLAVPNYQSPLNYKHPLLYLYEKDIEVTDYQIQKGGLLEVTSTYKKRSTGQLYVPANDKLPILAIGGLKETSAALKMLLEYDNQGDSMSPKVADLDLIKISAKFPDDLWIWSFEKGVGHIQKGTVYGTRINQDSLLDEIRLRGSPNQVGVLINVPNAQLKIRVLSDGRIQFWDFTAGHLIHKNHKDHKDPWPLIQSAIQKISV